MKVCLTLICLFFLTALKDGDAVRTVRRKEGQNIKFGCKASLAGIKKLFCKGDCKTKILVGTTTDRAQSGRYGIEYQSFADGTAVMNVSIRDLKRSDTAWYRCALYNPGGPLQYADFHLIVNGASNTSAPNSTLETFTLTFLLSTSEPRTAATPKKKLSSFMPKTIPQNRTVKPEDEADPLLYVGLSLAIMIVSLPTGLMIYWCRKRSHPQKDSPVETENDDVSQTNPEREETKEDRQNNSSAEEISSLYR